MHGHTETTSTAPTLVHFCAIVWPILPLGQLRKSSYFFRSAFHRKLLSCRDLQLASRIVRYTRASSHGELRVHNASTWPKFSNDRKDLWGPSHSRCKHTQGSHKDKMYNMQDHRAPRTAKKDKRKTYGTDVPPCHCPRTLKRRLRVLRSTVVTTCTRTKHGII